MFKAETPRRKKRRKIRVIFLLIALFLAGSLYLLIGGSGSNYFKVSLRRLLHPFPVFNHLIIEHNGVKKRLTANQTLHAHPRDRIKIVKIVTSVHFNRGIRLYSQSFDVNALQEGIIIAELLPGQDIFHHYTYTIEIKHRNKCISEVGLVISPSVEDWLEKADRLIDPKKRTAFLNEAIKEKVGDHRIKIRLADEYLAQKRWKEGANIIEDIIKERADLPAGQQASLNFMKKLVDAYEHLQQHNKVIATLKKILLNSPENMEIRLRLAELLEKKGRLQEAINEYTTILPKLTEDEKIVCMKNIGYLFFQIAQKEKALEWYLKAAKYDTKDPNLYYNIGSIYDDLKRPQLAEKYLRLALELKKDDIGGRLRLGQSLLKKGELKEAKRYTKEILEGDPNHLEALILLANIIEKEGDKITLKKIYEKILSHDPKNTIILFNLGVLEAEGGDVKKGLHYFERLVKVDPKDIQAREALFDIYQRQKRDDLAFNQAVALIELAPRKISFYRFIFKYLMAMGEFERSAEYILKGVEANPKNFELKQYLILAYLGAKKNKLAEKEMEKALKLRPNDTTLLHQLAKLKEEAGNLESALQFYKKILDISTGDEKAEEAYLRLRLKLLHKGK